MLTTPSLLREALPVRDDRPLWLAPFIASLVRHALIRAFSVLEIKSSDSLSTSWYG